MRLVPPRALFDSVPVTEAASLALAPRRAARRRSDTTAIVLAEPASAPLGERTFSDAGRLSAVDPMLAQ